MAGQGLLRRPPPARERAASTYLDYGFTQPRVIDRGPYEQRAGEGAMLEDGAMQPTPAPNEPELVPTPAPNSIPDDAVPAEPAPAAPKPALDEPQASASGSQWKALAGRSPASGTGVSPVSAPPASWQNAGAARPNPKVVPTSGWSAVDRLRR